MDFYQTDLTQLHDDLVNKKISATELTKATFDHIKANDDQVKAFLTLNEDAAMKRAAEIDNAGVSAQQLVSGVPLAVKDNILTKGLKTTAASKILENFNPVYDATVVERLNQAGFINVGKTNLDEFAMGSSTENSAFFTTHNPWDLTRVPGGSSGGSAAAVAAGDVLGALGTDTGGSIRMPASFNGVVGMKPTYGRVSRWGIIAFGSSFDQVGWLTRTVKDNAYLTSLIAGNDEHDMTSSLKEVPDWAANLNDSTSVKGLRIAVPKEYFDDLDEDVHEVIKAALDHLESLGAVIDEVTLPHTKYGVPAYYILASSEASSNLQRYDGIRYGYRAKDVKNLEDVYVRSRTEGFGEEVKRRIMLGTFSLSAGFYDAYFNKAAKVRRLIAQDFDDVFKDHDLILGATGASTAFKIGAEVDDPKKMYMNDVLTVPVNMAGLPSMSVPAGFSSKNGMPVGLQIIGKPFDEQTIYNAGYVFEQTTDFHKKAPKLGGQN
ncbi:Asp-tRNA(Asn)/Glu-tRNA(Gln) amidotransferase subunit GatA [Limosilactobacillus sp.]|jgi:aspartyl-tRNA(Asn)/glutamyl-tRNA(Gln) amidotransferase subunit A|uniref:Asp-tRNA(Asn)/Glu-tRNA(Gln) amidotransferase subunit GatA n=1 Tax=Limosilactobacillus sp. TaxID=2773925 RepID=UPI0025BFEBE8|nr:Asp-tRNA(Asn)/Glu-tRNA(Gln) amidotransferase subunit GatA [Limosilactobacillus sp.]MCH3921216.1 Asp-tRNA(Asn)/Glu-tRNA(Gln) amidotransferase subunit GatA [Limosilactobacillus sp.]MCH3927987.1 Asp-tRNA(Asn)/Glu-tRNA(Gln) amidotransferase subunit GatA [Limosilactobacillus sp.]